MKTRRTIFLIVLALALAAGVVFWQTDKRARAQAQKRAQLLAAQTRQELQHEDFKLDFSDFNLTPSAELRERMAILTNVGRTIQRPPNDIRLFVPKDSHTAIVLWKKPQLKLSEAGSAPPFESEIPDQMPPNLRESLEHWRREYGGKDLWPGLRTNLNTYRAVLDNAAEVILSGQIRFEPIVNLNGTVHLPYLGDTKKLEQSLAYRTLLDLHDGNKSAAWTNLLASTRLVTSWKPEPTDNSHLTRFGCARIAYSITWQALQADYWTDDQLATLQHEWETTQFLEGLSETAAWWRVSALALCQNERTMKLDDLTGTFKDAFRFFLDGFVRRPVDATRQLAQFFSERRRLIRYRAQGSYEDETAAMLYFRERENEMKQAVRYPSWQQMLAIPSATNFIPFLSTDAWQFQSIINMQFLNRSVSGMGKTFLAKAAEEETNRRILITAIALTRYRLRHGNHPASLNDLLPDFLQQVPLDFMNGLPLRYQKENGSFFLYSVGLDCIDHGGRQVLKRPPGIEPQSEIDLVWPSAIQEGFNADR